MNMIILNGNQFNIDCPLSVAQLLAIKKYTFPNIIVRINGKHIKKNEYESQQINDQDEVQIIHMISGG